MKGPFIKDVTIENFQSVLEESLNRLVLFYFTASWCGPCKTFGPQLEALADEYKGTFLLGRIDVDQEPELAGQFRVQSVPTVFAIYKGQPIHGFSQALPVSEVRRFLDDIISRLGIKAPAPEGPPTDPAKALRYWQDKVKANPADGAALLALGRMLIRNSRVLDAREQFLKIDAKMPEYSAAQAALQTLGLAEQVHEAGGEDAVQARLDADSNDWNARYLLACSSASRGDTLVALDGLIDCVQKAPSEVKEDAKKAAKVVFEAAGRDIPEVEERRRRLTRLLF
jgi:putative thioredoxin